MGNVKIEIYCYLTADILSSTKVLQNCSLNSLLQTYALSKPLYLIGYRKDKFAKKYSNIISSEAIRGMKLKLCRMFITLASTKTNVLLPLLMCIRCYGNLKFPLTYNEKSESRSSLLSHCKYFDRTLFINVC